MDVVSIVDGDGQEIARGIANCASHEAEQIVKKRRSLSAKARGASQILVHRDNIVLMEQR
jgi:glutamate 5-kinase